MNDTLSRTMLSVHIDNLSSSFIFCVGSNNLAKLPEANIDNFYYTSHIFNIGFIIALTTTLKAKK